MIRTWLRKLFPGVSRPEARPGVKPYLVTLEDRTVPATLDLTANVLTYTGQAGTDADLTVGLNGSGKLTFATTADSIALSASLGGGTVTNFALTTVQTSALTQVTINLGTGNTGRSLIAAPFVSTLAAPFTIDGGGNSGTTFVVSGGNSFKTAAAFSATNFGAVTVGGTVGIIGAGVTLAGESVAITAPVDAGTGAASFSSSVGDVTLGEDVSAGTTVLVTSAEDIVVSSGTVVDSVASTVTFSAKGDVTATGATLTTVTGLNVSVDTDNTGGGTADLTGAAVTGGGVTLTGGTLDDTFRVSKWTPATVVTGAAGSDKLFLDGQTTNNLTAAAGGTFNLGGGTVTPGTVETITAVGTPIVNATGNGAANAFVLTLGSPATIAIDGGVALTLPTTGLTKLNVTGNAGADTLTVTAAAATNLPAPVHFDGSEAGSNRLIVTTKGQAVTAVVSSGTPQSGSVVLDAGSALTFVAAATLDLLGDATTKGTVNVTTGGGVTAAVGDGKDFATNTVDGIRFAGTAAPFFTAVAVRNASTVAFATTGSAAADAVTVNAVGSTATHGVTALTVQTGNDTGDTLTVAGAVGVTGNVTLTGKDVTLNAAVGGTDVAVNGGGAVSIAAAQAPTGTFSASAGTTLATAAGSTVAGTAVGLTAGTTLTVGAAVTASTGNVTLQGGTTVTLNANVATTLATKAVSVTSTGGAVSIAADQTPGGSFAAAAGTDLSVTSGKLITVTGTNTLGLKVGQSAAGVANLIGADLKTGTQTATLTGGGSADTFNVGKMTAAIDVTGGNPTTAPGDTLVLNGQTTNVITQTGAQFQIGGGGKITPSGIETVSKINQPAGTDEVVTGTTGTDILLLTFVGGTANYSLNGGPNTAYDPAAKFVFNGDTGDDVFTVDLAGGKTLADFTGVGITFDGQGGDDLLVLRGSTTQTLDLKLDAAAGNGTATIGTKALTFVSLAPVDVSGMLLAIVDFTFAGVQAKVQAGKDFATDAIPAIHVVPNGTPFEAVALWNNTTVVIDTTVNAGSDTVTVNSTGAAADHKNTNLTITTVTAAGEADQVTFTGAGTTDVAGDLTVTSKDITTAAAAAITAGGSAAFTALGVGTITHPGTLTAGTNATFTATAGIIVAVGGTTTATNGAINFSSDNLTAGTTSGKTGVTLAAAANANSTFATSTNGPVSITALLTVFSSTISAAGNITLSSTNNDVTTVGNAATTVGTATVSGKTFVILAGLSAPGAVSVTSSDGTVSNSGITESTGSTVTVNGKLAVDLAGVAADGNATVASATKGVTNTGATASTNGFVLVSAPGTISLAAVNAKTSATLTSSGDTVGAAATNVSAGPVNYSGDQGVTLTGNTTADTSVTLTSANGGVSAQAVTGTNDFVTITADDAITATAVTGKNAVLVDSATGSVTLTSAVSNTSTVTVDAGDDLSVGTVTAAGAALLTAVDQVTVTTKAESTGSTVSVIGGGTVTVAAIEASGQAKVQSTGADAAVTSATSNGANVDLSAFTALSSGSASSFTTVKLSAGTTALAGTTLGTTGVTISGTTSASTTGTTLAIVGAVDISGGTVAINGHVTGKFGIAAKSTVGGLTVGGAAQLVSPNGDVDLSAATNFDGKAADLFQSTIGTVKFAINTLNSPAGATLNLVGTTVPDIISANPATMTGAALGNEMFTVTKFTADLKIFGLAEMSADTLVLDGGPGKINLDTAPTGTPNGTAKFLGGGLITYTSIESVSTANVPEIVVTGSNGDDVLTVFRNGTTPYYTFFDGVALTTSKVEFGTAVDKLTFNGLGGNDTMVFVLAAGETAPTKAAVYDGGAGTDGLRFSVAGQDALYVPDGATAGSGTVTVGTVPLTVPPAVATAFSNLEEIDFAGFNSVTYRPAAGPNTLTVAEGFDFTITGAIPALNVSGFTNGATAVTPFAVWKTATLVLDTAAGGAADTVTISGAANAHNVANLTVTTGTGADAVNVTGNATFAGAVTLTTQDVTVAAGKTVTAGTSLTATLTGTLTNNGTLAATAGSVGVTSNLVAANFSATAGDAVSLSGTTGVTSATATAGNAVTLTSTTGKVASTTVTAGTTADLSGKAGVTSQDATAGGAVSFTSTAGTVISTGTAKSTGSTVTMTGQTGVTSATAIGNSGVTLTSAAGAVVSATATSAGGPVSLTAPAGAVTSTTVTAGGTADLSGNNGVTSKDVTAAGAVTLTSANGAVIATGTAKSTGATVAYSGKLGVSANVTTGQTGVSVTSSAGSVTLTGTTTATTGNVTGSAGTNLTLTGTTVTAPTGAVAFTFGGTGGASAFLLGSNLAAKAGTFATLTGGTGNDAVLANAGYVAAAKVDGAGGADTLRVSGTAVSVSGTSVGSGVNQYLGYANFETVTLDGAGVPANQATTVTVVGDDPFLGTTTPRADAAVVDKAGAGFTLTLNGQGVSAPGLTKLNVNLGALDDKLRLNYAAGTPIPTLGIAFDGGTGTDAVATVGTGGQNVLFTANGTVAGAGTLAVDADPAVSFVGVEGADFTKFSKVTLNYGGANDALTVNDGTGFVIAKAAVLVGGTTAGNTVTTAAVWSSTALFVDTGAVADGTDTVTVNGFSGTHNIANFTIQTGVGGDTVTVAGAGAVAGDFAVTTGGSLTVNANVTAGFAVTLKTVDAATAGQNIAVASGVEVKASAGALIVSAGDDVFAPGAKFTAGTTAAFAVDAGDADAGTGATGNLLNAVISAGGAVTVVGGNDADSFLLTSTVSPISLDGLNPAALPGDALTFDAKGLDVSATANSFAAGGAAVTYANIESLTVTNAKNVSIDGTSGDDTLTVSLNGAGQFQYQLNANPAVVLPNIPLFNFNGLAGKDLLVVNFAGGNPIPVNGVTFDGGADADAGICLLGNSATALSYDAAASKVSVSDGKFLTFSNVEATSRVDLTKFTAATLSVPAGGTLVSGKDATAGGTNAALVLSAGAGPAIGVWTVPSLTLTAAVTANAANGPAAGVSALTVTGGPATFTGANTFAGDVAAGAGAVLNAATLTAGSLTVTGATAVAATSTVAAGAGGATFNGTVDGPGGLTVNTPGATTFTGVVGGATPLASLTTDAGGSTSLAQGTVTTAGPLSFGDAVSFVGNGSFTSTGDAVTFAGGVTADTEARSLTIAAAKTVTVAGNVGKLASVNVPTATDVTFGGTVKAGVVAVGTVGNLTFTGAVEAPGGAVTVTKANNVEFGGTVNAGTVTVTAANDVTTKGAVTTAGAFAVTNAGNVTVGGTTSAGSVAIGTAGNVVFNGTVTSPGGLTVGSAGTVAINGAVSAASVTVTKATGNVTTTGDVTASGAVTVSQAADVTFGGTTTAGSVAVGTVANVSFNGTVAATGAITIASANNVTFGGTVTAQSVTQSAGTGTTVFSKQLSASGTGRAVGISSKDITFNGTVSAANGELYLKSAAGAVTQTAAGVITAKTLRLEGSGKFDLATVANAITGGSATQGELFTKVSGGSVSVWDSTDMFIRFENPVSTEADSEESELTAVRVTNGQLALFTNGNFDATDTTADAAAKYQIALIDVGTGSVRIFPGVGKDATATTEGSLAKTFATVVRFVAEAVAGGNVFIGNSLEKEARGNVNLDRITVRPSKAAKLVVDGNNPSIASGSQFSPWDTLNPILSGLPTPKLTPDGPNAGTYTFGDGSLFQALQYLGIETLGGIALQAFAVQTGPVTGNTPGDPSANKFAIRLIASQTSGDTLATAETTTFATPLGGNGSVSNPFVVSPVRANPNQPFGPPSVAVADVNADGTPDLIIANGPAEAPLITIIDGNRFRSSVPLDLANLSKSDIIAQFYAYEPTFVGGVTVKAADLNGDGRAELVVGARQGGGQRIQVFEIPGPGGPGASDAGTNTTPESSKNADPYTNFRLYGFRAVPGSTQKAGSFFAFDENPEFRGGVNVALGDVDGDGVTDMICGAGVGGGPRVLVYSGKTGEQINSFFAYEAEFRGGVYVDAGRSDGDLIDDILTAPGSGGGPRVRVFQGIKDVGIAVTGSPIAVLDFFAVSAPGSLVTNDRVIQNGLSGIAFGGSFDGSGGNRSILVSTPRGQQASILQFDPEDFAGGTLKGKPEDLAVDLLAQIVLTNPILGTDITKLRDGGSVGGFAAASGFE